MIVYFILKLEIISSQSVSNISMSFVNSALRNTIISSTGVCFDDLICII